MTNEKVPLIPVSPSATKTYLKTYLIAPGFRVSIDRSNAETPDPERPFRLAISLDRIHGAEYIMAIEYADLPERDLLYNTFDQAKAEQFYQENLSMLNRTMDEF